MFCTNCGAQMPDTAKFCNCCGQRSAEDAAVVPDAPAKRRTAAVKKKKRYKPIIPVLIIVMIIAIAGIVWAAISIGSGVDEDSDGVHSKDSQETEETQSDEEPSHSREDIVYFQHGGLVFYVSEEMAEDVVYSSGIPWDVLEIYNENIYFSVEILDDDASKDREQILDEWRAAFTEEGCETELREKNAVPYLIVYRDSSILVRGCYLNGDWMYQVEAEILDEDRLPETIDYVTGGECRSTCCYNVSGLILELSLDFYDWEIDSESGSADFTSDNIQIEVASGSMEDVQTDLGMIPANSVEFAQAYAAYLESYGEAVICGTREGSYGKTGYVVLTEENRVIGFYVHDGRGWLVSVYSHYACDTDTMIDFAVCGYYE